jgi:alkylhydroperoxidase family enzyme
MESRKAPSGAVGNGVTRPRVPPGTRHDLGFVNYQLAGLASRKVGTGRRLNAFTTIGRHRNLFRAWIRFARELMQNGSLPTIDAELVILRVAHNCDCEYEWRQHERIASSAGLSPALIAGVKDDLLGAGYSRHQEALLRAADELHGERELADATWSELRQRFSDEQMIELCMLVGNYEMVAMTLKSLRVEPDLA